MEEPSLPRRMFAFGEEPSGQRVNSYHKIKRTESIIEALEPEEVTFLRNSTFAKVLSLYENPPFSGAFGHFILVRRLKTNKKYEIWILFAGTPIRFSLREFAIVTGLNCGKFPTASRKRKNPLKEKLYWNELFGSLKSCTVETIVDMLKNKKMKDRDRRIKYACLAITSSVLLPSSHTPKIIPEHVEMIRDLDEFMAYPWGRSSFQLLMSTLVKKDEMALAQDSFVLQGFVDAIQLVMIAAVPPLKEEVIRQGHSRVVVIDSESDTEATEDVAAEEEDAPAATEDLTTAKYVLVPGHARDLDLECKVAVKSILDDPHEEWAVGKDFSWDDETEDSLVDNLVKLVMECFEFKREMFTGGLTAADISRLRAEKQKEKEAKEKQEKEKQDTDIGEGNVVNSLSSINTIANRVAQKVTKELNAAELRILESIGGHVESVIGRAGFEKKISDLNEAVVALKGMEERVKDNMSEAMGTIQDSIVQAIIEFLRNPISSTPADMSDIPTASESEESTRVGAEGAPRGQHKGARSAAAASCNNADNLDTTNFGTMPKSPQTDQHAFVHRESAAANSPTHQSDQAPGTGVGVTDDTTNAPVGQDNDADTLTEEVQHTRSGSGEHPHAEKGHSEATAPLPCPDEAVRRVIAQLDADVVDQREAGPTQHGQDTAQVPQGPLDSDMDVDEIPMQKSPLSGVGRSDNADIPPAEHFPTVEDPSFSLGVTQEGRAEGAVEACPVAIIPPSAPVAADGNVGRKSKRNRAAPAGFDDFQCDPKISVPYKVDPGVGAALEEIASLLNPIEFIILGGSTKISTREFMNVAHRTTHMAPKVMDLIMAFLGSTITGPVNNAAIFDSNLPAAIKAIYPRFVKTAVKDRQRLKFSEEVIKRAKACDVERLYFPFNIVQHHWIGVCIDSRSSTVHVLDCNSALTSDAQLKKFVTPIANMSPYIARSGRAATSSELPKPFGITRVRSIPQVLSPTDSAVMTALLIQTHSSVGPEGCKGITASVLPDAAKQLVVSIYNSPYGRNQS